MNTNNFKWMSNFFVWFFRIATILAIVGVVFSVVVIFSGISLGDSIEIADKFDQLLNFSAHSENIVEAELVKPATGAGALMLTMMAYIFSKASRLFTHLAQEETLFTNDFADQIKEIGMWLIIADVLPPVVSSIFMTLFTSATYYFYVGFSSMTVIGLLLYVISEIFRYGVTLQELSDETV